MRPKGKTKATRKRTTPAALPLAETDRPVVTQNMLDEYRQLVALCRRKEELRERILGLMMRGGAVEPGPLRAFLDVAMVPRCSWAKLEALYGRSWAQAARRQIERTRVRYLQVAPRLPARRSRPARPEGPGV